MVDHILELHKDNLWGNFKNDIKREKNYVYMYMRLGKKLGRRKAAQTGSRLA